MPSPTRVSKRHQPQHHHYQQKQQQPHSHHNGNGKSHSPPAPNDDMSSIIQDDEVKVNLAMADLMAYLQVVANNSTNLPLTRRDDPEVTKTVSVLTSDQYARKSAAFVPADVRVVAGAFAKYGRVWDLPTAEEYQASDGAQEPGVSYGGACANAMLKVLYDAANEQMEEGMGDHNDLFDDDDDEEDEAHDGGSGDGDMPPIEFSRQRTFQSLVLDDGSKNMTWADLLRKMKAEIQEIGYAQTPSLTTTRRFDLNQPFSLIPSDFDSSKNQKRSLLIGCNYTNIHGAQLKASHDDVRSMKDYIINVHGFPESKGLMTVLMDDDDHKHPTHLNITESLKALSEQSRPGDAVFIHFAGHGGRVLDHSEADSYDEVWCPSDYQQSGLIRDTLIFKTLLAPMRYGVTVTILIDCCDTGMVLDLPYSWTTKTDRHESTAKLTLNDDFSFVRFLKVIKTLYEASTFTQLGKSVGTALKHQAPTDLEEETVFASTMMDEYDEETLDETANTKDFARGSSARKAKQNSTSIFTALQSCTTPDVDPDPSYRNDTTQNGNRGKSGSGGAARNPSSVRAQPSLLEKVMACTLGGAEEDSDEDTYMREFGQDPSTTFESITEDGSASYTTGRRQ